jgi:ribonuclease-3
MKRSARTPPPPLPRIRLDRLQERLGITFRQRDLLLQALTHRSFTVEVAEVPTNERLEFLGDAVLDLVVAEYLFTRYHEWPEGKLTRARATVVDSQSLERVAQRWHLGTFMRLSHGELLAGGRARRALLADAVEAIMGAYYLDQGWEACRTFILRELDFLLAELESTNYDRDYKTLLQEYCQGHYQEAPTYQVLAESGPPHARVFTIGVLFRGAIHGRGEGLSKKAAEQQAALHTLRTLTQAAE